MSHFSTYISTLHSPGLPQSVSDTSEKVCKAISDNFTHTEDITGLLLGNVQSGKTGQMLGIISRMADLGYKIFILLTTDNIDLQQQTYNRVKNSLTTFTVLSEKDEVEFSRATGIKPVIIVLKKNTRILKKWRTLLVNANICRGQSLVILDDEADAASLNTLVNKHRISPINKNLAAIKATAHGGTVYLEVTATPQAIFLQSILSDWKPAFTTYFKPGEKYLGGNFFYSNPTSYTIHFTNENELSEILDDDDNVCPQGLQESIVSFLVNCAHRHLTGIYNCNFMIHPSVRIAHHRKFVERVEGHLNLLQNSSSLQDFEDVVKGQWVDLQRTKPDLEPFEDILEAVKYILDEELIKIIPLNSQSFVSRDSNDPNALKLDENYNIVIGGNTLGRGITFPNLQTVYYSRSSRKPQADTFWQHSRIFGYDREKEMVRIFIPPSLHQLFVDLNQSNELLIKQIEEGADKVQLIFPNGINPTRKNVLDNRFINIITGGTNYFPACPIESNTAPVDQLVRHYASEESVLVDKESMIQILKYVGSVSADEFSGKKFSSCILALAGKRPSTKFRLIVRDNRNISRGTGTLLSPTDRRLGDNYPDDVVLTLYRVNGDVTKGWSGSPLWIPNIKFPENTCYFDTVDSSED
ncbi:MAG: Z1 domain-containing protein [Lachnospiraceae bacterium]|nr:Z1 domain-containing protein [Lachnospiraceae bacterium]